MTKFQNLIWHVLRDMLLIIRYYIAYHIRSNNGIQCNEFVEEVQLETRNMKFSSTNGYLFAILSKIL